MKHLSETEFIDLLEGALPAERARHADECGICRTQIEQLRAALASGVEASVPDPSPLFWEHFAQRVEAGIGADTQRAGWWAAIASTRTLTAAGAIAAIVLIAIVSRGPSGVEKPTTTAEPAVVTVDPLLEPDAPGSDEGWAAVRAAAENVAWDDAREAGLAAQPGTADRAIGNLTDAERERLLALLAEDLKKPGE